jgi:hypothetical protein
MGRGVAPARHEQAGAHQCALTLVRVKVHVGAVEGLAAVRTATGAGDAQPILDRLLCQMRRDTADHGLLLFSRTVGMTQFV